MNVCANKGHVLKEGLFFLGNQSKLQLKQR